MNTYPILSSAMWVIVLVGLQACKREGCTDMAAQNYDNQANDNCCCVYTDPPSGTDGSLLFWTADASLLTDCGTIAVLLSNGEQSNVIAAHGATPGNCNDTNGGFFSLAAGEYTYQYLGSGPNCSLSGGIVIVLPGQCVLHMIQ